MSTSRTIKYITALAYDSIKDDILIYDQLTNVIYRYNMSNGVFESIMTVKNEIFGGMDFDYIGNNLYWSNMEHRTIEVYSFNTDGKTIFYYQEEPQDISLDSQEGVMYVVFHSDNKYRILQLQMNGLGSDVTLVDSGLVGKKISLCYDSGTNRLFWTDQGSGNIESISKRGDHRYIYRTGLSEPMSLTILGENIFWTERISNHLFWGHLNEGLQLLKRIPLELPNNYQTKLLVAIHSVYYNNNKQGCHKNNGGCSHVCIQTNYNNYMCACPPGMMLNYTTKTCILQLACANDEIKCSEHDTCIQITQLCDGRKDCPNGEDESKDCSVIGLCDKDHFLCKNGDCISLKYRCNSRYDCKDHSDEENCNLLLVTCRPDFFQCHSDDCIPKNQECDGNYDCSDYSDELDCHDYTCSEVEFKCENGPCIPYGWVCDGNDDCTDKSDEENCLGTCKEHLFKCKNLNCIDQSLVCNQINDCGDFSDETHNCFNELEGSISQEVNEFDYDYEDFDEYGNLKPRNCTNTEYKCRKTGICIPKSKICDDQQDCLYNDDENNCPNCKTNEYICENKNCITQEWVCDKVDDCGDNSDEKYCDGGRLRKIINNSEKDCKEYRCNNGKCIPFYKVCDNNNDCPDGSDELNQCMQACMINNPCKQKCNKTPLGPVCTCNPGYKLASDGISCDDINECEKNPCSQICHNTHGGYKCSCNNGYLLQKDKHSCKAFSDKQIKIIIVAGYDVSISTFKLQNLKVLHHDPNFDISGLDFNAREDAVYLSNARHGIITKINVKTKKKLIVEHIGNPGSIAIDWITNNVYFINYVYPYTIKACNLEEGKCTHVVRINGNKTIGTIKVDPTKGLLFWSETDWSLFEEDDVLKPSSIIYRSSMNGTDIKKIVTEDLGIVQKLAIDHMRSRLYWCDTHFYNIESVKFDGSDRQLFLVAEVPPLDIHVHDDYMYWLHSNSGHIKKCKLQNNTICNTIFYTRIVSKHFTIFHENGQPLVPNKCQGQECAYMCLLNDHNSTTCFCEYGLPINNDLSCKKNSEISISDRRKIINHQNKGMIIGITISLLTAIAIISVYYYYQQSKINRGKRNELSIHFQNLPYNEGHETSNSFNYRETLPPGEHEYINPLVNVPNKLHIKKMKTNKIIEIVENSESETENMQYVDDIKLIKY